MSQPGLPVLPPGAAPPLLTLLTTDTNVIPGVSASLTQWGLFLNGSPAIPADTFIGVVPLRDPSSVPDYPVEQGGFQSYNKVALPVTARARYMTGGSVEDRTATLAAAEAAKQSMSLYELRMPESTYTSMNVTEVNFARQNGEAGLIVVELVLEQIRQTATIAFVNPNGTTPVTNATAPGANDPQSAGIVQTTNLTPAQMQAIQSLPVTDNPTIPQSVQ